MLADSSWPDAIVDIVSLLVLAFFMWIWFR
jgi:hypothetical protein